MNKQEFSASSWRSNQGLNDEFWTELMKPIFDIRSFSESAGLLALLLLLLDSISLKKLNSVYV